MAQLMSMVLVYLDNFQHKISTPLAVPRGHARFIYLTTPGNQKATHEHLTDFLLLLYYYPSCTFGIRLTY